MNTQNRVWNLYAISYSYNKYYYGIMLSVGTYYYVGLYFQSYINLLCQYHAIFVCIGFGVLDIPTSFFFIENYSIVCICKTQDSTVRTLTSQFKFMYLFLLIVSIIYVYIIIGVCVVVIVSVLVMILLSGLVYKRYRYRRYSKYSFLFYALKIMLDVLLQLLNKDQNIHKMNK